ncbi:MAG: Mini-ribonuclease 3 [Bulleidia sp.]
MHVNECSGRTLAFLGDAVWSLAVRKYLLEEGEGRGKTLQKRSIAYVSAKAQAHFYQIMHEEGFLCEEEEAVFYRGRNANNGAVPKNTDVQTYRISTGFEAILGALELEGKEGRIRELFEKAKEILGE